MLLLAHRRRIYKEEKAKVVVAFCRTNYFAPGRVEEEADLHPSLQLALVKNQPILEIVLLQNSLRGRGGGNSVPQEAATTFAFSYVYIFCLCSCLS